VDAPFRPNHGVSTKPGQLHPAIALILHWRRSLPLFLPLAVLIWDLVIEARTPQYAAFRATVVGGMLYVALGSWRGPALHERLTGMTRALEGGGKGLVMLAFLGAGAQVIIGMVTLTGVGVKLSELLIAASGGSLVTALLLTALICTILGMGVTTTADYIFAASVIGPALVTLGLTPFVANLYIFYWASSSAVTPPVAAAVFVAAGLAGAEVTRTGVIACRLALAAFLAPFMFVYAPALLLQGSWGEIALTSIASAIGVVALAAGIGGYFARTASLLDRGLLLASGVLLVVPGLLTDLLGVGLLVAVWLKQRWLEPVTATAP
jgi:TRAP-type uncharacterized transport system fused permease subunit